MRLLHFLAALLLAASLGTALAQAPAPVDDEAITIGVRDEIRRAPSLAESDIHVATRDGVVTLSGFARSMEDIATAVRLARVAPGVKAVNNEIRIAIPPSRG